MFVGGGGEVAVIDWQWTGWNVAGHDLIYFFAMSSTDDVCAEHVAFMRRYHAAFLAALPDGAPQHRLPFDELMRLFQLATLDFVRL